MLSKLAELGWETPPVFEGTIKLPADPDLSSVSSVLVQAIGEARELGVCLVVYPESDTKH